MQKKLTHLVLLLAVFLSTFGGTIKPGPTASLACQTNPTAFTPAALSATWIPLTPTNAGPGPRFDHAMQYHPATNQIFLFGGRNGNATNQSFNDTWVLDLATLTWQELAVSSPTKPPVRHSALMMVDAAGDYLYVTIGQIGTSTKYNDIWRLNLATEVWQNLTGSAGTAPTARYASGGGNLNGNLIVSHGFATSRFDDTWLFNTTTNQWENKIALNSSSVPLKRCLLGSTTFGNKLVIHGGCSSGVTNGICPQDDTWILDTSTYVWHQVTGSPKPQAREYHSLAYFEDRNQVVLFGGDASSNKSQPRNDLWLLDLNSETWETITASGAPSARFSHTAAWIQAVGNLPSGMLVYGGTATGGSNSGLSDLWLMKFNNSSLQFEPADYSIAENEGSATINVTRTGDLTGTVTINYATANGTAQAGSDYTATAGTLTFGDGEAGPMSFEVPILNDAEIEGSETLTLTLSDPTGGAVLGNPSTASLTITNDDGADLDLTHTAVPNPASVNQPVTYTLTVVNHGPAAATGVTLTNTLPLSITFGSAAATQGSCNQAGDIVSCNLGTVLTNSQVVATMVMTPLTTGARTSQAVVSANEADPNPANNNRSADTFTFDEGSLETVYLPVILQNP